MSSFNSETTIFEFVMEREFSKFALALKADSTAFTGFPTESQRDWLLGQAIREFAEDLAHLDTMAPTLVPGSERPAIDERWETSSAARDDAELIIQGHQVMQAWERPLMRRLAMGAARSRGDVLEVGFGMGISATFLLEAGVRSYTVIECNDAVVEEYERWRRRFPGRDIRLVKGRWQDVTDRLTTYDGILFDTYPLSQDEYLRHDVDGVTHSLASEFFPVGAAKLRPGGVMTYYTNEIDTLSRGHQRMLLRHFDAFEVSVIRGLTPPVGCQYWWADSMAIVEAKRG